MACCFGRFAAEFVAASRKLASQGFTPSHAWRGYVNFMDVLPLILPSPKVMDYAQALHADRGFSFWDAIYWRMLRLRSADALFGRPAGGDG